MTDDSHEGSHAELKRADHSIYISLKYTKSVDLIKSIVKRLIGACDCAVLELLQYLHAKKKIPSIPASSKLRSDLVLKKCPQFKEALDFIAYMREIDRAIYTKKEEYKKNVALIVMVKQQKVEVDIERLKSFYQKTYLFVEAAHSLIGGT